MGFYVLEILNMNNKGALLLSQGSTNTANRQSENHYDHLYYRTGVPSEFMPVLQILSKVMHLVFRSFHIQELDPKKANSLSELGQVEPFMNNLEWPTVPTGQIKKPVRLVSPSIHYHLSDNHFKDMMLKLKSGKGDSIHPGSVKIPVEQSWLDGENNNDIIQVNDVIYAKKHHISYADLVSIMGNTAPNYPVVELKKVNNADNTGKLQIKYKEGSEILSCWIDVSAVLKT